MLKNINTVALTFVLTLLSAFPSLAEEAAHHGKSGLPQFDPTSWPSQIFWLAIFFVILYFVFAKSIIPAIGGTIDSRMAYIADNIKKAETLSSEADALRAKIDAEMKSAGHKAAQNISDVENTAKKRLGAALTDFRVRYERHVEATEIRINAATTAAMADMEQIATTLAAQAAEKIAGIPASESGAESVVKSLSQKAKLAA